VHRAELFARIFSHVQESARIQRGNLLVGLKTTSQAQIREQKGKHKIICKAELDNDRYFIKTRCVADFIGMKGRSSAKQYEPGQDEVAKCGKI